MTMKKTIFGRLLSLILSFAMVMTSVIYPVSYVYAEDGTETGAVITVNGTPFRFSSDSGKYEADVCFGDTVTFEAGNGSGFSFSYVKTADYSDDCDWNEIVNGTPWLTGNPGRFYIGYTDNASAESFDDRFVLNVKKGKIGKPETVRWSDGDTNIAQYSVPSETETGGELLSNAVSNNIKIALYKDGSDNPCWSSETSVLQYSLRSTIEEKGFGDYRFSVQFLSSDNGHYTDGDVTFSNIYSYRDTTYPVITEFKADAERNILTAKAKDTDTGVFAYAFSTEENVEDVLFTNIDNPAPGDVTLEMDVTDGGIYYLYVKDGAGLVTKAENPVTVTVLRYHGLYADNVESGEKIMYFYGNDSIVITLPTRTGYLFTGYYDRESEGTMITDSELSIDPDSRYFGTTLSLYALWKKGEGSVTVTPSGETKKEYDGSPIVLTAEVDTTGVSLDDPEVKVEFVWSTLENGVITGETGNSISVTDATDGPLHYICDVIITLPDSDTIVISADPEKDSVEVEIEKKKVSVSSKDITIHFGENIPENYAASDFDYHDGLIGNDIENVIPGTVGTTYVKGSPCGVYSMIPGGFSAKNYEFSYIETENLQVIPASDKEDILVSLSYVETVFDGSEKKPEVTVTDTNLERILDESEYSVSYRDNVFATSAAAVTVTLSGNYEGTVEKTFEIKKAPVDISVYVSGYIYGETPETVLSQYMGTDSSALKVSPEGTLKIYARNKGTETWIGFTDETAKTLSAGEYEVKGVFSGDSNYLPSESLVPGTFTVGKRTVIFASGSGSWTYDGSAHSIPTVVLKDSATVDGKEYTSDGFASGEGYKAIYSNTSVTEVTEEPVKNEIKYEFFSAVDTGNYEIVLDEGTLEITGAMLVAPGNVRWNPTVPGEVTYIAVSRPGLTVSYEISLYRAGGEPVKASEDSDTFVTSKTSFDLSDAIRKDSEENGTTGYYVQVKAVPVESRNYLPGVSSRATELLYTAHVKAEAGTGTENVKINGENAVIMIAGETAELSAEGKTGYEVGDTVWTVSHLNDGNRVSIKDCSSLATAVTLSSSLAEEDSYVIFASLDNEKPEAALSFDRYYASGYESNMKEIQLDYFISDTSDLYGYDLVKTDGVTVPSPSGWTHVTDKLEKTGKFIITVPGTYYLFVKDESGNVTVTDGLKISKVTFTSGGGEGSMDHILKVEGYDVKALPHNSFVKTGYGFTQWTGENSGKIYTDGDSYVEDIDETLVANWSNTIYSYSVNYYLMGLDGNYSIPSKTVTSQAVINTVIESSSDDINTAVTGYTFDPEMSDESITVTEEGLTLNLYYRRNQYTVSYEYTDITGETVKMDNTESYLYGETMEVSSEVSKPVRPGYSFAGWKYTGVGERPATMPGMDITAKGSFVALDTEYDVLYFTENLDGTYSLNEKVTRTEKTGTEILFSTDSSSSYVKEIDGFTVSAVSAGTAGIETDYENAAKFVNGTVVSGDSEKLSVSYFYTRNTYKITLNITRTSDSSGDDMIYSAYWTRKYGENISDLAAKIPDYYEMGINNSSYCDSPSGINQENATDLTGYILANYIDYSTGSAPVLMPNGDVTVNRKYISDVEKEYFLNVYFEKADGTYEKRAKLTYFAPADYEVSVIDGDNDTSDHYNPYTSQLSSLIEGFEYYELKEATSGKVSADGSLTLDAYFERKTFTANIYYYYNTDSTRPENAFGTVTLSGKWGTLIEDFDPLLYFDNENEKINGMTYKENNCVVSYSSYYDINKEAWPQYQFSTVASLTSNEYRTSSSYRVLFGHHTVTAYVRYIPVEDIQFGLNVQYTQFGGSTVPVTYNYSYNGVTSDYRFRIVNKRQVVDAAFVSSATDFSEYPGLEYLYRNGTFTYGDVKEDEGWVELTDLNSADNSASYRYFINENDTDKVIYIVKNGFEDLYAGSRYGINLDDSIPYILMKDYEEAYNGENSRKIVLYNRSASGIRNRIDGQDYLADGTFTFNFRERHEYRFYHSVLGNLCSGHVIYEGDNITYHDLNAMEETCEYVVSSKEAKAGYNLTFYDNGSFTEALSEKNDVDSDITVYGRYTRNVVTYRKFAHYEIPGIGFITDEMIELTSDGVVADVNGEKIPLIKTLEFLPSYTITDGDIFTEEVTPGHTSYYMGDDLVLVDEMYETLTYSEIEMDYTKYGEEHYLFSEKNPLNSLNGYVETTGIELNAYFERIKYTLTKDDANETDITSQVRLHGETVTFADPERPGYEFAGWKFTDKDGNAVPVTVKAGEGTAEFAMPKTDTKATAVWETVNVDIPVFHFVRTEGTEKLEDMVEEVLTLSSMDIETVNVKAGNTVRSGKAYYMSDLIMFVSVNDNGKEYFYLPETEEDETVTIDEADLFAVAYYLKKESESEITLSDEVLSLSYATLDSTVVDTLKGMVNAAETVEAEYGMKITYYYARLHNLDVNTAAVSTDGGEVSATLNVSGGENGKFAYGETAAVSAGAAPGYRFEGWFNNEDVMDSEGNLLSSWVDVTPYSTGASSLKIRVYDSLNLTAVFTPLDLPGEARVTLAPNDTVLTFGYLAQEAGNIVSTVLLPEGTDSTVKVKSYSWYRTDEEGTVLDSAVLSKASSLKIPQGLVPGEYYYKCIVEIERTDNGRTKTLEGKSAKVTVVKADLLAESASYEGTYDGKSHGISVALSDEKENLKNLPADSYMIYYSESPIYLDDLSGLSEEEILKKDVKIKDGSVSAYDIYYAIVPGDDIAYAYNGVTGHETVKILKKRLTLISADPFNKKYDGETEVLGSLTDSSSDKYRLSFGSDGKKYYSISGLQDGDAASDYTIDFDAEFNSSHSNDAGSVTLSDIRLVSAAEPEKENTNYYFDEMFTLGISGSISKKEITIEWTVEDGDTAEISGNHFTYVFNTEMRLPKAVSSDLPEGFTVTSEGAQRYAGENYKAQAVLSEESDDMDARDYMLLNSSVTFSISKLDMNLGLNPAEVTYDGKEHTVETAVFSLPSDEEKTVGSGDTVTVNGKEYRLEFGISPLVNGETRPDITGFTDAGLYPYGLSSIKVYDANGTNVTDSIRLDISGGSLTIAPAYVKAGNITASSKVYDGTDKVTSLDTAGAVFEGMIAGDSLSLDDALLKARFSDKDVENGKTVYIEIPEDALLDGNGVKAKNYRLSIPEGETVQTVTATASITEGSITLAPGAFTDITYGDSVLLALSYEEGLAGDDRETDVTVKGEVKFTFETDGKKKEHSYTLPEEGILLSELSGLADILFDELKLDAGTYTVKADCSGLSAENYEIASSSVMSTFRVSKKSISLSASEIPEGKELSKVYDGNTDVPAEVLDMVKNNQSDYFTFTGVIGKDSVNLLNTFTGKFDRSSVKMDEYPGAEKITLTGLLLDNPNYTLTDTSFDIPASVTQKGITVKVNGASYVYGTKLSDMSFTVTGTGLVSGEKLSDIAEFSFVSYYDDTDPLMRDVVYAGDEISGYDVNIDRVDITWKTANYDILENLPGLLKITPKEVTVSTKANTEEGKAPVLDQNGHFSMSYGEDLMGYWFKPEYRGFAYPEDTEITLGLADSMLSYYITVDGNRMTFTDATSIFPTIAGNYSVMPVTDTLNSIKGNYTYRGAADTTTVVNRRLIDIADFVEIVKKVYDGTVLVPAENIRIGGNDIVLTGNGEGYDLAVTDFDYSYLGNGDKVLSLDLDALKEMRSTGFVFDLTENGTVFEDRNVGERTVNLVFSLNDYLGKRYTLIQDNLQKTADSEITRRPLKITAVSPENTIYGSAVPEFSNTYDSFAEGEDVSVLEKISEKPAGTDTAKIVEKETGEIWVSQYVDTESNYTEKGEMYIVTPTGFKSGNNGNYFITYESTTINVVETKLDSPLPLWEETPGSASFTGVSGIGDVTVEKYQMSLFMMDEEGSVSIGGNNYRKIELPAVFENVLPETSYDLSPYLKENGKGAYSVAVKAYASEENNTGKWNVGDSDYGVSGPLKVLEVTLKYDETDSVTAKGTEDENLYTLKINGEDTPYIAIEGEQNIPFTIENTGITATGYTVKNVSATGTNSSAFTDISGSGAFDGTEKEYSYSGTFSVERGSAEGTASDELKGELDIRLETVKADLIASLSIEKRIGESTGLSDSMVYNYTESPVLRIDTDVKNGDTVDKAGYEYTYVWNIKKQGSSGSGDMVTSSDKADVSRLLFPAGKGFGTYFVTCTITAKRLDNGEISTAYVTNKVLGNDNGRFTITVTKADFIPKVTVDGWMYGEKRNTPVTTDLPEELQAAQNQIQYFYSTSSDVSGVWTPENGPEGWSKDVPTDAGTYYVAALIKEQANYNQTLAAPYMFIITENTFGKVEKAVLETNDSEDSTYGVFKWEAVPEIKENDGNSPASTAVASYDITVEFSANGAEFTKVKEISGAEYTEDGFSIEDCITAEGIYRVNITAVPEGEKDSSNVKQGETASFEFVVLPAPGEVKLIEKTYDAEEVNLTIDMEGCSYVWYRDGELLSFDGKTLPVTFVTDSGIYYGNAVKNGITYMTLKTDVRISKRTISVTTGGFERKYNGEALTVSEKTIENVPERDVIHYTNTGTVTDFGKAENTYTLSITHDDETVDILDDNYTVESTLGELSILKRDVILESPTRNEEYSGYYLEDHNVEVKGDGFADNEGADFTVTGKQLVNGTSDNAFTYELKNNTKAVNYNITPVTGTLTVTALDDAITVTAVDDEKTYDGTPLANSGFGYTDGILRETDTLTAVVEGTITDPGTEENVVKSYKVMNGTTDVTSCYTFAESVKGTLEVKKVMTPITVTAASDDKVYDGTPLENAGFSYTENILAETDTLTAVVEGTVTFLGTEDNIVTSYKVLRGEKDVTENYTFTEPVKGTLEIRVVPDVITITANSRDKIYDGEPLTDPGYTYTEGVLREGDALTATVEGTITDVGTEDNIVTSYKVLRGEKDVTENYTFGESVKGTLEVKQVDSKIRIIAESDEKVYDGTPLENSGFRYTEGILITGDVLDVKVEGSITDLGTTENRVVSYTVLRGETDVTDNYQFETPENGTLEIKKVTTPITVTAGSNDKVYDGTPLTEAGFTYTAGIIRSTDTLTAEVSGTVTNAETADNTVVSFKVMRGEIDATKNYTFSESVKGTLTVTPRPVELVWTEGNLLYTGAEQTVTAKVSNIQTGDSEESFEITYADNGTDIVNHAAEVGSYTGRVAGLGNSNYTLDKALGATGVEKDWTISYLVTDSMAEVIPAGSGKLSEYGWYNSNVYMVAPEGFLISEYRDGEYSKSLEITAEGYTELRYYMKETATGGITDLKSEAERKKHDGTGSETVADVAIDKTPPKGTITVLEDSFSGISTDESYSLFYKNAVEIKFSGTDDIIMVNPGMAFRMLRFSAPLDKPETSSGIASIKYRTENTEYTEGESFTLEGGYKGRVYLLVTDKAGNTTEISTDRLVVFLDSEKMTETVTYERTSGKTCAVEIKLNGNTVLSVSDEKGELEKGVDYRTNDYGIVLLPKYLETKRKGSYTLQVTYNPMGEAYVESGDMNGPASTSFTLNAVKAKGAVTDLSDQSKTYDGSPVKDLSYKTLSTGVVRITYEGTTADGREYRSGEKPAEAGTYRVRVESADDINYEASSAERTFEIYKEKITLTALDRVMYKGESPEELSYKVSGKLHNPLDLGAVTLTCDVTEESEAGDYDILVSYRENPNYEVTVKKGTYTVLKKTVPYVLGYYMRLFKGDCIWHWIILGLDIASMIALLVTNKRKDYDDPEEKKDKKKASKKRRIIATIGLTVAVIFCNIFGKCALEAVMTVLTAVTVLPTQYFTFKHKFGDDK